MTIAHDASSESHTGTSGDISHGSFTWNHIPSGTPKGILVFTFNTSASADIVTSVTYGGVTVPAVSGGLAVDTLVEPGNCKAYFLGTGVLTGTQAVVVNRTNNANEMYAVAISVTAAGDTEVAGVVLQQESQTPAEANVDDSMTGANSVRYAGAFYGGSSPPGVGANSTALQSIDFGVRTVGTARETTAGTGSRAVGFAALADDWAGVLLAVREASRYWVGGSASWDGTVGTKWSGASGGTGGSAVPTLANDVFLDAASGAVTVTIAAGNTGCKKFDCTGFTGTVSFTGGIDIYGSFKLVAGMTYNGSGGIITFKATTSETITSAGKTIGNDPEFNGVGGTWTLQDALTASYLILTNGTFNANNQNVTLSTELLSNNSNTRTLTMGSGTWTLTGTGTVWNTATTTGLTLNANTSEIKLTDSSATDKTFAGGGLTYNNFTNDTGSTGKVDITGANTFNIFDMAKTNNSRTVRFTAATTNTFTSFITTAGTGHTLTSITAATHTLSDTTGTNSISNTTVSQSIAQGGATWNALTTNGNVDGGSNTGWNFSAVIANMAAQFIQHSWMNQYGARPS